MSYSHINPLHPRIELVETATRQSVVIRKIDELGVGYLVEVRPDHNHTWSVLKDDAIKVKKEDLEEFLAKHRIGNLEKFDTSNLSTSNKESIESALDDIILLVHEVRKLL